MMDDEYGNNGTGRGDLHSEELFEKKAGVAFERGGKTEGASLEKLRYGRYGYLRFGISCFFFLPCHY